MNLLLRKEPKMPLVLSFHNDVLNREVSKFKTFKLKRFKAEDTDLGRSNLALCQIPHLCIKPCEHLPISSYILLIAEPTHLLTKVDQV